MGRKIKLSHEEVDVKLFLEVLGVYAILALALAGAYYLEPAITGFAAAESHSSPGLELIDSVNNDGIWTVSFTTAGTGDLSVSAINGSYSELYNDNFSTINNLGILELRCGNYEIFSTDNLIETESAGFVLMDDSEVRLSEVVWLSVPVRGAYVENYNCDNKISHFTVRILEGNAMQQFRFGDKAKFASS